MDHSSIRQIKYLAKRLKKQQSTLSYCQCLDLVAQRAYGARHFHEVQKSVRISSSDPATSNSVLISSSIPPSPSELRYQDWPYFDIPEFAQH